MCYSRCQHELHRLRSRNRRKGSCRRMLQHNALSCIVERQARHACTYHSYRHSRICLGPKSCRSHYTRTGSAEVQKQAHAKYHLELQPQSLSQSQEKLIFRRRSRAISCTLGIASMLLATFWARPCIVAEGTRNGSPGELTASCKRSCCVRLNQWRCVLANNPVR